MHIVIIGNGISGVTAARFTRKLSDHQITIISSESQYFYSRTALMYIYMGHMRQQDTQPYEPQFWKKNRINLVQDHVDEIDFEQKKLLLSSQDSIQYDKLILALGSASNKFGWPGQDLDGVHGLYNLQDLQDIERHSIALNRAVIVGGGLIGIELAEMFRSRHIPVTILVREKSYWSNVLPPEESEMINRHIKEHHIDLRLSTELDSIKSGKTQKVQSILTKNGETIPCGFVGLTAGVHPNVHWLRSTTLDINKGILVNEFLQTNEPDVFAIGDCAELRSPRAGRRPVEAIWYTGRMMGETVAHTICRKPTAYDPGLWFNSAKFLDIEYQVYGHVPANLDDQLSSIYYEHPDGKKSIRINYHQSSEIVTGFNLMGIRFRHEVCERWILSKASITEVLKNLKLAFFDPEFFEDHHKGVLNKYREISGKEIEPASSGKLNAVLKFLKAKP